MDWQNLDKKMNSLRQCMDVGDYAKARPLYEQLQAEYYSQTDCGVEYEAIGGELAEIYAAIVVETNSQQEIPAAIAQLQKFTGGAYHGFLVARLSGQKAFAGFRGAGGTLSVELAPRQADDSSRK